MMVNLGGFKREEFTSTTSSSQLALREEYNNSSKDISYEYFVAIKMAEESKLAEVNKSKSTIEVIDYIDKYYDVIYKDITSNNVNNKALYNKAINHLQRRFKNFDEILVAAKLESYNIYSERKLIATFNFKVSCTAILMILSITALIVLALFIWIIPTLILYLAIYFLINFHSNISHIKVPE